jgi:hypothetical protein
MWGRGPALYKQTFMSTATEASPEGDEDEAGRSLSPMMTEAVGLLVTGMAGKTGPLAWISCIWLDPPSGCVSAKSLYPKRSWILLLIKNFG